MTWLTQVPMAVVAAYAEMLPKIQADEEMAAATSTAVGHGTKPGHWIRKQWSQWGRQSRGRGRAVKATPANLAALGIGMVKRDE